MKPACSYHAVLEWVHVEVSHNDGPVMARPAFLLRDIFV
jgi:hypothetical protein